MGVDKDPTTEQPAQINSAGSLTLTVAICTRDRPQQLARALASIAEQRQRPQEIMVIDNAPADSGVKIMVAREFPAVRYVIEPIEGLDFARNRALSEAQGDIVAFLDDDAVAHPAWTEAIMKPFTQDSRVSLVTGRVEALSVETEAARLFEANGGYGRGLQRIELPADAGRPLHGMRAPLIAWAVSVGNGTNFALRKDIARTIGGFDEAFDLGAVLHGGGDLDIFWRMLEAGYTIVYQPDALAWHEHRVRIDAMAKQLADHQRALVAFLIKSAARTCGSNRVAIVLFLLWRLFKPGVRLLRRLVGRDPLPAAVLLALWGSAWQGLTAYRQARAIAQQRKEQAEASL